MIVFKANVSRRVLKREEQMVQGIPWLCVEESLTHSTKVGQIVWYGVCSGRALVGPLWWRTVAVRATWKLMSVSRLRDCDHGTSRDPSLLIRTYFVDGFCIIAGEPPQNS